MIVLDTSALVYWTLADERLSPKATQAIGQAERVIISSISIWEVGLKVKNGKLALPLALGAYVEDLKNAYKIEIVPVTETTWLKNIELSWMHKDPADRTIVATASLLGCPLISSDQQIQSFYQQTIW